MILSPLWKRVQQITTPNEITKLQEKQELVIKEFVQLSDKDFIPIEDLLNMMEKSNPLYSPNVFIETAKEFPEEFRLYLMDKRPLDPYDDCV
jgi:hypothetical protein